MFMTRCFQSLAPEILERFWGPLGENEYSRTGLNVVPPLLQGISIGPTVRYSYSLHLEASPDPEIQRWPAVRKGQRIQLLGTTPSSKEMQPMMKLEDYQGALTKAIGEILEIRDLKFFNSSPPPIEKPFNSIDDLVEKMRSDIRDVTGELQDLVLPFGTLTAGIAIVLENDIGLAIKDTPQSKYTNLPWGIRESGFTVSNSLIWPFTLRQQTLVRASYQAKQIGSEELEIIRTFNQRLIQASDAQVVILCGHLGMEGLATRNKVNLELRGIKFDASVEMENNLIKRVYIYSPAPLSYMWMNDWHQAKI
jgi:hypothetical protein